MNKRKFKFIDLADDDYIEEEIVNQKESNNVNQIEIKKIQEKESIVNDHIQEETKLEVVEEKPILIRESKIINVDEIKNAPNPKPKTLEAQKNIRTTKDVINKNGKVEIFFKEKEKLDVKTNIYLKKDNYARIEEIYKTTGNSRSSIINKLIEIALNKINDN
ncbi:MAG: hypothetical protein ACRCUM_00580 [Mycoplasmoidaceae bacterium]